MAPAPASFVLLCTRQASPRYLPHVLSSTLSRELKVNRCFQRMIGAAECKPRSLRSLSKVLDIQTLYSCSGRKVGRFVNGAAHSSWVDGRIDREDKPIESSGCLFSCVQYLLQIAGAGVEKKLEGSFAVANATDKRVEA
ncbi:hypothetical protein NA56DRAFT_204041 [Hyaloscypha hepaticicola]|uniref:Uncharacterized protein n=1 Tax=Hyaloscypha hepaticicola TaxID=2082293 RepID=A0A2J6PZT3_9HELO|nr:hypothetical protein NA56DRAFT_204041 [Hyaloscypha hepaticicola]